MKIDLTDLDNLPQLAQDKANHFLYGQTAALLGAWISLVLGFPVQGGAVLAAVLVGAFKEVVWDLTLGRGDPTWGDFWATAGGAVPVLLGMLLIG